MSKENDVFRGDIDALTMMQSLECDELTRNFLKVIFNYELDQGEDAQFRYKEIYRNIVKDVSEKKNRVTN